MIRQFLARLLPILLLGSFTFSAYADRVTPRDTVTSHVKIRLEADGDSTQIGTLQPGEHLEYVTSVTSWHKVRLDDGQEGFVIKRWTQVIPGPIDLATATPFAVHFAERATQGS